MAKVFTKEFAGSIFTITLNPSRIFTNGLRVRVSGEGMNMEVESTRRDLASMVEDCMNNICDHRDFAIMEEVSSTLF